VGKCCKPWGNKNTRNGLSTQQVTQCIHTGGGIYQVSPSGAPSWVGEAETEEKWSAMPQPLAVRHRVPASDSKAALAMSRSLPWGREGNSGAHEQHMNRCTDSRLGGVVEGAVGWGWNKG
jgi:hypothetical protein